MGFEKEGFVENELEEDPSNGLMELNGDGFVSYGRPVMDRGGVSPIC